MVCGGKIENETIGLVVGPYWVPPLYYLYYRVLLNMSRRAIVMQMTQT